MNSMMKKIIFVIAFVFLTLVLPGVLLLILVDSSQSFSAYVIAYGVIIFAILGYVVGSVRNMEKKLEDALEEIKMQNAAIAYKLSNSASDFNEIPQQPASPVIKENIVDTTNIPLNPAEPLVMPTQKSVEKVADDGFDDFK